MLPIILLNQKQKLWKKPVIKRLLNKENIIKNQVDIIEQFKVLTYLKEHFNTDEVNLYLLDRFTIKLVDKNSDIDYFKYNSKTKSIDF